MNLLLFAIMVILLIFLIFYIKSTNKDFYEKYLYFLNNKINIINISISLILLFILTRMISSEDFIYKISRYYIHEEIEIFMRFSLFFIYTLFIFKFHNLKFIKDIYSNKITIVFFLFYFLWMPIFFDENVLEKNFLYFVFSVLLTYFIISLIFYLKKKNKNYIIIPVFLFIFNFISIFIVEKNQSYHSYQIKENSLNEEEDFIFPDYSFPLSFYPSKTFKLKFNGVIEKELFSIYYKDGKLSKIKFSDRVIIDKYNKNKLLNIISYFINKNIYDIEEAENSLTSIVIENNSGDILKKVFEYPYELIYIEDKIAYVVDSKEYIPDYQKVAFLFKKQNYIRINEWNDIENRNTSYIIKKTLETIKINSEDKNYKIFLNELGIKK